MKSIIILCLFISGALHAQKEILKDSSGLSNIAGVYTQNDIIQYRDGTESSNKTPYADANQVLNAYVEKFRAKAASMAVDAQAVSRFNAKIKDMIAENDQVIAVTGKNPLASIQVKEAPALTDNDYLIKGTTADQVIKFTVNGSGVLKYRIDTAQQKNAVTLGAVLRLGNFPANGTNTVFYRMPSGKYIDMNNTYTIHLAGQSANKASRDAPIPPGDLISDFKGVAEPAVIPAQPKAKKTTKKKKQ